MQEGDVVHVLCCEPSDDDVITVDDQRGLVVVNPDQLVSGTSVVGAMRCMRRYGTCKSRCSEFCQKFSQVSIQCIETLCFVF